MTQVELAEAMGISQAMVAHLESGRCQVVSETLFKLAEALKVTPGYFLKG